MQFVFLHDIVESTISRWSLQENGSDFTLSKPTEGVKLSGAAAGGATVNGSTLWRFWYNTEAEGATYTCVYESLRQKDREGHMFYILYKYI